MLNGSDEAAYLNYYMRQTRGDFTTASIKIGSCLACPAVYAFSDPTYASTDYRSVLPTSHAFIHTDAEATSPTTNTSMIIDRTGWTSRERHAAAHHGGGRGAGHQPSFQRHDRHV